MNRRWFLAGLAAAVVVAGVSAEARVHHPYRGHRIVLGGAAPLDGFTSPSGAYSFRKLKSDYTGFAVKLQRVDTTTLDVGFTASGDFDKAAATAFCTTACTINTRYDQSGNGRHLTQATAANQPPYVPNCNGTLPCMQETASTVQLLGASFTPATGVASFSVVAMKTGTTGFCTWLRQNGSAGNRISTANAAPNATVVGGTSGSIVAAAADNAWHSLQGVVNGAASVLSVDGVETTGTATGSTTASTPGVTTSVVAPNICNSAEEIFWDNYSLAPAERAALYANQRNYWFPAPLDSFTQPSGAYSFRKLRSTYAGPAIRIRRASDNLETDINFLGCTGFTGCPWDEAAAASHCAATSCFGRFWYDQSGTARDLSQAVTANQPQLVFNCKGSLPCWSFTSATMALNATGVTGTLTSSFSVVANRSVGTGTALFFLQNGGAGNRMTAETANLWLCRGGASANVNRAAADAAWHAGACVVNGAASSLTVDGATGTATTTGNTTVGVWGPVGGAATTMLLGEAVGWDTYTLTAPEIAVLGANQKSFWGTP